MVVLLKWKGCSMKGLGVIARCGRCGGPVVQGSTMIPVFPDSFTVPCCVMCGSEPEPMAMKERRNVSRCEPMNPLLATRGPSGRWTSPKVAP